MLKIINKLLAFVCFICPLCIFKRARPNLKFSKTMNKIEKFCPFCAAYKRDKAGKTGGLEDSKIRTMK